MSKARLAILIALLLLGTGLRLWDFPHRHELRHGDEENYMIGSLHLLEGMIPPFKYAPAGPQTWAGWFYVGTMSARDFFFPPVSQRGLDIRLRPFFAVNDAIWTAYADEGPLRWVWILVAYPFVIWSIYEAFLLGEHLGGLPGATVLGGLTASLPLFVELTNQARPYMLAWALAIIAISILLRSKSRRGWVISAIIFGLSIGSRIDMLALLPIAWSELWHQQKRREFMRSFLVYHFIVLVTLLLVAPWLLTNLIGNLRIIATVRLSPPSQGPVPITRIIQHIVWNEGLLILPLLALVGLVLPRLQERRPRWLLNVYLLLVILSMLKATGFGLQHQGAPVIVLILLSAIGLGALCRSVPSWGVLAAGLLLVLPLIRSVQHVREDHRNYIPDGAVAWIEHHVPPGTRIYLTSMMRPPLPTVNASNALWAEVNDGNAWQKKFLAGMERFHLNSENIPRALSDEDMLVERGQRRRWFILGSRTDIHRPRFDLRLFNTSPIFGVHDLPAEFARTGGVILWRGNRFDPMVAKLTPAISWTKPGGDFGTFIFLKQVHLLSKAKPSLVGPRTPTSHID